MTMWSRVLPARVLVALLAVAALALSAEAQYVPGSGELVAKDKLAAKGCGHVKDTGPETVDLAADGTWTTNDGGDVLSGTYVTVGTKGRKFDLTFDAPSLALFQTLLEGDFSDLCQQTVLVTTIDKKRFQLKLNRAGTKAKMKAKFRLTGTANGKPGKGSFKLKAKGPWMAMPLSPSGAFLDE
jgi:hypothetical protein